MGCKHWHLLHKIDIHFCNFRDISQKYLQQVLIIFLNKLTSKIPNKANSFYALALFSWINCFYLVNLKNNYNFTTSFFTAKVYLSITINDLKNEKDFDFSLHAHAWREYGKRTSSSG